MDLKLGLTCMILALNFRQTVFAKRVLSYAGPFKAHVEKWYQCSENKPSDKYGLYIRAHRLSSPTALQRITGNITVHIPFNDTLWMVAKMDLWNNNQWKENAFLFKFPKSACSSLRANIPDLFEKFFKQNPYSKGPCLVVPKAYSVTEQPINWTFPNFPVLPYGTYRFKLSVGMDKDPYGCTTVETKIQPQI